MGVKLAGFYVRSIPKLHFNEDKGSYEVSAETEAGKQEGQWLFLFVDLILVALISKISMAVEECELSSHTMTFQCVMFISMFMTRLHMDDYVNRFYSNDVFHRFFYFVYIMAFFIMALNVNIADSDHTHSDARCDANLYSYGYGIGFLLSRLSLLVMYLSVMMEDKRAFEQFFSCVARTALSMFLVIIFLWYEQQQLTQGEKGAFVPEYRMYIYLVACFVEWGAMSLHYLLLGLKRAGYNIHPIFLGIEYFPINVETYQERFGAFILMVLGEAIIMICVPYFDVKVRAPLKVPLHPLSPPLSPCYSPLSLSTLYFLARPAFARAPTKPTPSTSSRASSCGATASCTLTRAQVPRRRTTQWNIRCCRLTCTPGCTSSWAWPCSTLPP